MSLKLRLGIGASLLVAGSLLTAMILWFGMKEVTSRLDAALAAETRMSRYAVLSTQVSTFLVVATEAIQTELRPEIRADRIAPVADRIVSTFGHLQTDVEAAVAQAEDLGLDEQSRYGTQSLGLARMQALLERTLEGLRTEGGDKARLRGHIDNFAANFDPLLSQAVNSERVFRNAILDGIDRLRRTLSGAAIAIAVLTVLLGAGFYFGLIRPQFRRLDRLSDAANRIAQEDFAVALPDTRNDEIGQLYAQTNRMAAALADRHAVVQAEWARLTDTIAEKTEALRTANATLARTDEDRRRFFADISHELRTPLTVILMEAQLGRREYPLAQTAFETIEARAAKLNRRIDDLLRVARSDSGQLALDPQIVQIETLLRSVTEEIRAEVENAGMTLQIPDPVSGSVVCDQNWMRQVLVSLVRNAIRHARDGRHLAIAATVEDGSMTWSITDNGPGIAGAEQDAVFRRFTQGGSGNAQGFGVGLALARWVVEEHDGDIHLTSPVPRTDALGDAPGTKIAVRLPLDAT